MIEEYYIVCLEQKSREGTLLFWRPDSKGYTSSLEEAGIYDKEFADDMNMKRRDIALTKKQLKDMCEIYTVVDCSLLMLKNMKGKTR